MIIFFMFVIRVVHYLVIKLLLCVMFVHYLVIKLLLCVMSAPRPCWKLPVYQTTFCGPCRRMCYTTGELSIMIAMHVTFLFWSLCVKTMCHAVWQGGTYGRCCVRGWGNKKANVTTVLCTQFSLVSQLLRKECLCNRSSPCCVLCLIG